MKLDELIRLYEGRIEALQESIDEIDEIYGDDFNASDASGGNFDDAYELGDEHGSIYAEYEAINQFIKDLKALKEDD